MKTKHQSEMQRARAGFTLIEIIGVVAVIAILAAVLTPRVVSVIARGKVSAAELRFAALDADAYLKQAGFR